ncbi:hypothetical protein E4W18_06045 [Neisseria meningitidis]|nr:hypothetical protein [Neisseria meningitidis]
MQGKRDRSRFKALRVPHCRPFKHGVYLTGAQSALSFTEQADWIPAYSGMTKLSARKPAPRHSHESGNPVF